jgi:hypothetical protein
LKVVNTAADDAETVLRLSWDAKMTVRIGDFARGGNNRLERKGADHDFKAQAILNPFAQEQQLANHEASQAERGHDEDVQKGDHGDARLPEQGTRPARALPKGAEDDSAAQQAREERQQWTGLPASEQIHAALPLSRSPLKSTRRSTDYKGHHVRAVISRTTRPCEESPALDQDRGEREAGQRPTEAECTVTASCLFQSYCAVSTHPRLNLNWRYGFRSRGGISARPTSAKRFPRRALDGGPQERPG